MDKNTSKFVDAKPFCAALGCMTVCVCVCVCCVKLKQTISEWPEGVPCVRSINSQLVSVSVVCIMQSLSTSTLPPPAAAAAWAAAS